MAYILIFIVITVCVWKWFYYRAFCLGLMYFAETEHNWNIDKKEIKKIIDYAMKRIINDFCN